MGALESYNPATGELIGSVETVEPAGVQAVVADVAEVCELLSREQGKPITEAYTMEVVPTIDGLNWIADEGPGILDEQSIKMGQGLFIGKKAKFAFEPLGVVGIIAPWNYPWSIPFGEVALALMAGNGVVLKPSELTPLIGDRIRVAFEKAGIPDGLIRVVQGDGTVGQAITESTARKIFFTGSVKVGYK